MIQTAMTSNSPRQENKMYQSDAFKSINFVVAGVAAVTVGWRSVDRAAMAAKQKWNCRWNRNFSSLFLCKSFLNVNKKLRICHAATLFSMVFILVRYYNHRIHYVEHRSWLCISANEQKDYNFLLHFVGIILSKFH